MKTTSLLLAIAAVTLCGAEVSIARAQAKNPPPPVHVGGTVAATPSPATAPPAASANAGTSGAAAAPPPSAPAQSSAAQLEKLAMPIALHPDPLVAIILPASVYPVEIVQAARFVKNTNNVSKIDEQPWDENVKAVAKFPDLIAKMDADLSWTIELGQAFLDQPKELKDTIQALRSKAQKAGTLRSSDHQVVTVTNVMVYSTNVTSVTIVTNTIVQVQPSNPQVVYVPSYPPTVYYPPPSYVYDPWAPLVTFGVGMAWGAILANNCDWHGGCVWGGGDVDIDIDNNVNIDRGDRTVNRGDRPAQQGNRASSTGAKAGQQKWQPNQSRLRTAGAQPTQNRASRGWSGGTGASSQMAQRPAGGAAGTRPSAQPSVGGGGARPSSQQSISGQRPSSSSMNRPSSSQQSVNRSSPSSSSFNRSGSSSQRSSGFNDFSSGSGARDFSSRGASSRGGGGYRGGGGRGGRR